MGLFWQNLAMFLLCCWQPMWEIYHLHTRLRIYRSVISTDFTNHNYGKRKILNDSVEQWLLFFLCATGNTNYSCTTTDQYFLRRIVKLRLHVSSNTHFWAAQINIKIIAHKFAMRCKCEKGNWTRLRKIVQIVRDCAKLCSMICVSSNTNYWGCWSILGKLDQQWREAVIVIHSGTRKASPALFSLMWVYIQSAQMPRDFFAQCNTVQCKMQIFTGWCNLHHNCKNIGRAVNKWAVAEVARLHWNKHSWRYTQI